MLKCRRVCGPFAVAVLLTFAIAPRADAAGLDPVDCSATPNDAQCQVVAKTPDRPGGAGSGGGGGARVCRNPLTGAVVPCSVAGFGDLADDGCYYQPATGADLQTAEAFVGPVT